MCLCLRALKTSLAAEFWTKTTQHALRTVPLFSSRVEVDAEEDEEEAGRVTWRYTRTRDMKSFASCILRVMHSEPGSIAVDHSA